MFSGFMNFEYVSEFIDGFEFSIEQVEGKWVLYWTDCVANEWTESYDLLSHAVARLACITACAESDYSVSFAQTPENFEPVVDDFFRVATH